MKRGLCLVAFPDQFASRVGGLLRSASLRDGEGVKFRLSFGQSLFVRLAFSCEQSDIHGIQRGNRARLLQHVAIVGTSTDRTPEILERPYVREELVQFLPDVVV